MVVIRADQRDGLLLYCRFFCNRQRQWENEYIYNINVSHMIHGLQPFVRHVNHDELKLPQVDQQQFAQHLLCVV